VDTTVEHETVDESRESERCAGDILLTLHRAPNLINSVFNGLSCNRTEE